MTTTVPTVSTDLTEAAELIMWHGWVQGHQRSDDGRICSDEAVALATNAQKIDKHDDPRYVAALCRLADTINPARREIPHRWAGAYIAVTEWNDKEGQTKQNVIDTLKRAALEG